MKQRISYKTLSHYLFSHCHTEYCFPEPLLLMGFCYGHLFGGQKKKGDNHCLSFFGPINSGLIEKERKKSDSTKNLFAMFQSFKTIVKGIKLSKCKQ